MIFLLHLTFQTGIPMYIVSLKTSFYDDKNRRIVLICKKNNKTRKYSVIFIYGIVSWLFCPLAIYLSLGSVILLIVRTFNLPSYNDVLLENRGKQSRIIKSRLYLQNKICIPALPMISYILFYQSFCSLELSFPIKTCTDFIELFWEFTEIVHIKNLTPYQRYRRYKYSIKKCLPFVFLVFLLLAYDDDESILSIAFEMIKIHA